MNIKFSDDSALWDQRLQCLKQLRESRVDVGLTASASPRSRSKSSLHRLIRISQSRWQLKQQISFSLKTLAEIIAILSQSSAYPHRPGGCAAPMKPHSDESGYRDFRQLLFPYRKRRTSITF